MVDYQPDNNNRLQSILGASLHQDIGPEPEIEGFTDSPEGIEDMRQHRLKMINPERLQPGNPMDAEYITEQVRKAEEYLVSEGYEILRKETGCEFVYNKWTAK